MSQTLSTMAARRLRPVGAFHVPPAASPVRAVVRLKIDDARSQPEAVISDARRPELTWRVVLTLQGDSSYAAEIMLPPQPTILTYVFTFSDGSTLREKRQKEGRNTPIYGEWEELPFKIAVYDPERMPADWTHGMVIYQIFPDRFADGVSSTNRVAQGTYGHAPLFKAWGERPEQPALGRDFFGGDLRGVIDHLDHIERLGIDMIYFTPIFQSPTNHRYDAINFLKIDPMLGTDADFDELVQHIHARGMKVMLDGVFNHCSADSVYFQEAKTNPESPYYRWFHFTNYPIQHKGWQGFGFMPEFVECPEMEDFFCGENGVTAYWLRRGIDGWRLDVAYDNSDEFWRRFRARVDAVKPGAYTVSELWVDSTHYFLGDTFSATMNYRFTWLARGFLAADMLTPTELDDRIHVFLRDTPPLAALAQMNQLDSHDTNRILTACGGDRARLRAIYAFQLAFPGAPMIYYGGETGLEGDNAEDGRRCIEWDKLDDDMVAWLRDIIHTRRRLPALRFGDYHAVVIDDARATYGFRRTYNGESVVALFTASDQPVQVTIPGLTGAWRDVLSGGDAISANDDGLTITLAARGAAWLVSQ